MRLIVPRHWIDRDRDRTVRKTCGSSVYFGVTQILQFV